MHYALHEVLTITTPCLLEAGTYTSSVELWLESVTRDRVGSGPPLRTRSIFLPPTQPLASTVLGFLRGHPFEDGPWVTHGIPELAL